MKFNKLIVLIISTLFVNLNGGELCTTMTDAFQETQVPEGVRCSTKVNKDNARACIKQYLGSNTFKTAICPFFVNTLNRDDIKRIDSDITNTCEIAKGHMATAVQKLKALKDEYSRGSGWFNAVKLAAATAAYQSASAASQLLNLNVIQEQCKNILASKRKPRDLPVPTPQTSEALFSEEIKEEEQIAESPQTEAEIAKDVAKTVAQDVAKKYPGLTPTAVAQAIAEEIKDEGIPAAPPIGDLAAEYEKSSARPTTIVVTKKPVTPSVKAKIKEDTGEALRKELEAAIKKRRAAIEGR